MPVYPANEYNGIVGPVPNGILSQPNGVVVDNNSLVSSAVTMDGSRNDVQNGVEGIDVPSILCPSRGAEMEDTDHVFVKCDIAVRIWESIFHWIDMVQLMFGVIADVFNWIDVVNIRQKARGLLEAIIMSAMRVMWQYQNNVIFGAVKMKKSIIFDRIVSHSFEWCSSRGKDVYSNCSMWLQIPMTLCL
ncbi:RNA-directed DNA polymerase, eukaryota, Reverse transcriptase zinc-binding domain protein [Artemisia annua]|uniref:RNA-directed DNA polymerase, eukaryota, Reverse transcriptase zinc-binding domain protein n=1 Tax=Artemisia annua TaxID=35608 RepID=A0A2U1KLG3_ARTAN|nr:RNA-directed DNA polymerase, eukaryota, Reverse transcriptase zinc-binding domain protein [Artemisia annua]